MTDTTPMIVLLGPQAPSPTLGDAVDDLGVRGPIATITAGWQEWESDDAGLRSQLGDRLLPLSLYERAERVWAGDTELREAHAAMQMDVRLLQNLYARQLARAGDSWMELLEAEGPEHVVEPERAAALEAIQRLDARHLERIGDLRTAFEERYRPLERLSVARERAAILSIIERAEAVVIEGGHAAVIHNRIRLFDLRDALKAKPVVGCAAGAMVLGQRVVLFNDLPAIGRGHAEIGLDGLALVPGVDFLPDATRRLRLDDAERMRRLALRLAPDRCALLDPGDRLVWDGTELVGTGRRVDLGGTVLDWGSAA